LYVSVSCYGIPGIYYVCNFLLCPIFAPRSYRGGKLCFQNNFSLLVLLQQYNFFSVCPIWLPLRHFLFSTVTNSNIQTHPTLNVTKAELNVVLHCNFSIILKSINFMTSRVKHKAKFWTSNNTIQWYYIWRQKFKFVFKSWIFKICASNKYFKIITENYMHSRFCW
jgi:hypothetical protein